MSAVNVGSAGFTPKEVRVLSPTPADPTDRGVVVSSPRRVGRKVGVTAPPANTAKGAVLLDASLHRERWRESHDAIGSLGSGADDILTTVLARQREVRRTQQETEASRNERLEREAVEWEATRLAHSEALKQREEESASEWERKSQAEREIDANITLMQSEMKARAKAAQLRLKIDLMRREAVHNGHMVADSHEMSEERAQAWLDISALPTPRLVLLVFDTIDVDGSHDLEHAEIYNSPFGEKLAPHWEHLDPDGDGSVSLEEWVAFFGQLKDILGAEFDSFMVLLPFEHTVASSPADGYG